MPGLSGASLYLPRPQVQLAEWCAWTGASPEKTAAVVGDSFRVAGASDDVYTLAANAVLQLMRNHRVDPSQVGLLLLATESSQDNAVGGPTLKGLVDLGLQAAGRPPLSRNLETYELKQACLSGMNGLLAACRFVAAEPDRVAIVVAADIAEYARGSSGEPTQGAGAVAMLVEATPRLLEIDVGRVGRSAADRVCDFRKPARTAEHPHALEARPTDYPTFLGPYSTHCYLDAVSSAFEHLAARTETAPSALLEGAWMLLSHRPYEKMPRTSLARLWLTAMLETEAGRARLAPLAERAEVSLERVRAQLFTPLDLPALLEEQGPGLDPTPELTRMLKWVGRSEALDALLTPRTRFGRRLTRQLGNLYSASLPAWIGAALEEAAAQGAEPSGPVLLLGYGSGDAALALSARLVPGWSEAALELGFEAAASDPLPLERRDYEATHDRTDMLEASRPGAVRLQRVGRAEDGLGDVGIPRYGVAPASV